VLELPAGIPSDVPGLWEGYASWFEAEGIRRPRVVIHGGYGKNNLGDDAILDVLLTRTLEHFPKAAVTIVCHGPDNVKRRYRALSNVTACHFKSVAALSAVFKSHLYFIGGGGIVNKINVYSGRQRFKLLDMKGKYLFLAAAGAKLSGAKTHFYAIGATSFPDPGVKLLARLVLASADVVSVRDPLTIDNIRSLGVSRELVMVLDPAMSMKPGSREEAEEMLARWGAAKRGRPRVCIGFRYVREPGVDNDEKVRAVARLTRHLIDRGNDVIFLPASQHPSEHFEDDLHFGREVKKVLGNEPHFALIEQYYHPRLTMAALGAMDFCVLERLHAVILTSLTGVPFYTIAYDDKVSEYVKLIKQDQRLMQSTDFSKRTSYEWIDGLLDGLQPTVEATR
jgi:polysaccharide pyruvyl transferase WcaK-like protein